MAAKIDRGALRSVIANIYSDPNISNRIIEDSGIMYLLHKNLIDAEKYVVNCLCNAFRNSNMVSSGGSVPSVIKSLGIVGDEMFSFTETAGLAVKMSNDNIYIDFPGSSAYASSTFSSNEYQISAYTNGSSNNYINANNGNIAVTVYMAYGEDTYRPSLREEKYGGVFNIVSLFDTGYDKDSIRFVTGDYKGNTIHALSRRARTNFMKIGVEMFNAIYGGQLHVHADLTE